MKKNTAILILSSIILISCGAHSVETEMDEWCNCRQQAKTDPVKNEECIEIMQAISVKYEFDPEAVVIIQTKAEECK